MKIVTKYLNKPATLISVVALIFSGFSLYKSYFDINHDLSFVFVHLAGNWNEDSLLSENKQYPQSIVFMNKGNRGEVILSLNLEIALDDPYRVPLELPTQVIEAGESISLTLPISINDYFDLALNKSEMRDENLSIYTHHELYLVVQYIDTTGEVTEKWFSVNSKNRLDGFLYGKMQRII